MSVKPTFRTPQGEPIIVKRVEYRSDTPFILLLGRRVEGFYRTEKLALKAASLAHAPAVLPSRRSRRQYSGIVPTRESPYKFVLTIT
jgi:hypothetical protein